MGSTTQGPFDPTSTTPVDTQLGNSTSGCILIHNLSQYELLVTTPDALMNSFVAAWGWRRFDVSDPMPKIKWSIVATPNQANPPLSAVFVESYELKSDAPPQYFGQYQRQVSVGGGSVTTSNSYRLFDAGNSTYFDAVVGAFGTGDVLRLRARTTSQLPSGDGMGIALSHLETSPPTGVIVDDLLIDPTTGQMTLSSPIASIGGETTAAGALGVPLVDGLKQATHVTATTQQTILTFTPASTGTYRVSGYVRLNNGVSGNIITAHLNFVDPDAVGATTFNMDADNGTTRAAMNGGNSFTNGAYAWLSYTFRHTGGQAITVTFLDPTNTPSDFVTAFVERIA